MTFIRNINVTMITWNNCRNWSVSVRSATHKPPPKIIIDEKKKEKIFWQVLSAPHAGGVNAIVEKITQRYYWKGVKGDVKTYVSDQEV